MFNLLKSDLYRLVHGKMLWVMTACLAGVLVLAAATIHLVSSPEFLCASAQSVELAVDDGSCEVAVEVSADGEGTEEVDEVDAAAAQALRASGKVPSELTSADFEDASREMRVLESPLDTLGDAAVSGGVVSLLTCLLVTLLFAGDFATGFARNLVMDRRGRLRYYGEKLMLAGLAALYLLLVATAASLAAFALAGFTYERLNTAGEVVSYLGLAWMIAWAYGCLAAVVVWLTRSSGAGIAFAIVVGSGMVGALIGQGLLLLSEMIPWTGVVQPWLLASCQGALGSDVAALIGGTLAGSPSAVPPVIRLAMVALFWMTASAVATFAWLRKRDV